MYRRGGLPDRHHSAGHPRGHKKSESFPPSPVLGSAFRSGSGLLHSVSHPPFNEIRHHAPDRLVHDDRQCGHAFCPSFLGIRGKLGYGGHRLHGIHRHFRHHDPLSAVFERGKIYRPHQKQPLCFRRAPCFHHRFRGVAEGRAGADGLYRLYLHCGGRADAFLCETEGKHQQKAQRKKHSKKQKRKKPLPKRNSFVFLFLQELFIP